MAAPRPKIRHLKWISFGRSRFVSKMSFICQLDRIYLIPRSNTNTSSFRSHLKFLAALRPTGVSCLVDGMAEAAEALDVVESVEFAELSGGADGSYCVDVEGRQVARYCCPVFDADDDDNDNDFVDFQAYQNEKNFDFSVKCFSP